MNGAAPLDSVEEARSGAARPFYLQLWFLVLLAMAAGITLGVLYPDAGARMAPLGDAFIKAIRMLIAPIVFCTVVHGIAGMASMARVGRVALKALIYFEVLTTIALVVGLAAVNLLQPGVGMNVDLAHLDAASVAPYLAQTRSRTATQFLLDIIPNTFDAKLERLGCEESVVGLVIPAGYSFNLDGTCLYLATAAVFLAQATNTPLGLEQQLGLLSVLLLASKGAAGVAGAAFVVLAATLAAVGTVPVESVALILGIHRLMSQALTPTNLIGNGVATLVIAKWERALDERQLQRRLARKDAEQT